MDDKQAIILFQLAAKQAATIPIGTPIKILKYQARRLLNLPDQSKLFEEDDMVAVVATVFPVMHCLRKIVSWDQIRQLINDMEKGETISENPSEKGLIQ